MIFTLLLPILGKIVCECVMTIFTISFNYNFILQVKMDKYLAHSVSEAASVAWTHYTTTERAEPLLARLHYQSDLNNFTKSDNLNEQDEVPTDDQPSSEDEPFDPYTAQSLVCELNNQVMMSQALAAEAKFIAQQTTFEVQEQPLPPEDEARGVQYIPENMTIEIVVSQDTTRQQSDEVIATQDNSQQYLAECMVGELLSQQAYSRACAAETRFTEVTSRAHPMDTTIDEPLPKDPTMDTLLSSDARRPIVNDVIASTEVQMVSTGNSMKPRPLVDAGTSTEPHPLVDADTNTEPHPLVDAATSAEPRPLREVGCNTMVHCLDVLRRAKEVEELNMLKADHIILVKQLNEDKSQRMVADNLVKIIQSDLSDLRQKNVCEVTTRMRLENDLGDAKAELMYANRQLTEKEARIKELEDSLTGTSILVRKLEEQNSISLMNRGGIDYMLQAKLADGRAREAEQKLGLVQAELLQTQTEVRMLLERVGEVARERTESVSSKVHTQLLQLADERAMVAEQRAQDMEREIRALKDQLSSGGGAPKMGVVSSAPYGLSYGSTYSPLSTTPSFLSSSGLSSYPSTSLGATYSTSGYLSHDKPSYLLPSSLKTFDPLKPSSFGTEPLKSHDYMTSPYSQMEPKVSHDLTTKPAYFEPKDPEPKDFEPKEIELPLVSNVPSDKIPPTSHVTEKDDSGSSDWSSSDEETSDALLPSSHRTLISQWEWRAMNKDTPTSTPSQPTSAPSQPRRRPPLIAPKPKHLIPAANQVMTLEAPSSFTEAVRGPSLLTSKRVRGPRGRRLPVRFSKASYVLS